MPKKDLTPKKETKRKVFQAVKGMRDVLPEEQKYWDFINQAVKKIAEQFGFGRIDLPLVEATPLYARSVGQTSDIVEKEMYSFTDKGEENITLRPEFTAGIVRSYVEHGMLNLPQPVKLYTSGPCFRYDRPQSGRYRQFYQFGFEILGEANPVVDAQLIAIVSNFFNQIGLDQISLQVNSIGCPDCRKNFIEELVNYYRAKRKMLCEDCKNRLTKNPLRLLDCKQPSCQFIKASAPQIVDWLCENCKTHFMKVAEYLDSLNIFYKLNPYLVRGLDYYTRTVFEVWPTEKEEGSQSVLGGGGRYDGLVELLGGRPTPAVGVSLGVERIILQLKQKEVAIPSKKAPDVFLAQIGDAAKIKAFNLYERLRQENILVAESFAKDSLKSQLDSANKLKVKYALILGQKEVMDGTILIREMESGVQEIIDFKKTVAELKKKLNHNNHQTPVV